MEKTFGRANDNSNVIPKPDIGRHHAKITLIGNESFVVEDMDSTNGVYVNGYRIQKATVSLKDEVRLSESTILNLAEIFGISVAKPVAQRPTPPPAQKVEVKNYTAEFSDLKQVWDDYQKLRIDINKKYQTKSTVIRSILSLAPLAVWITFQHTYLAQFPKTSEDYQSWQGSFIYFSVIGGALGNLIGGLLVESPQAKLSLLDEEFRVRYVCPNNSCRTQLGGVPWQSYYNQGKCFRCQAKYSDEGG